MDENPFPITRQVTGGGCYHIAYVFKGYRAVKSCKHKHRKHKTAMKCAEKMTRMWAAMTEEEKQAA